MGRAALTMVWVVVVVVDIRDVRQVAQRNTLQRV